MERYVLGIDIGGSGIKGAPVDLATGTLTEERFRIPTPQPSVPEAVAAVVEEVVDHFGYVGPVGCTIPSVVKHGIVESAANIDDSWIGIDGRQLLERTLRTPAIIMNDADAAGIAEISLGAGRGRAGLVCLLTLGTGIGSALFADGILIPNTEFGHLEYRGGDMEHYASARVRKDQELSWEDWGGRVGEALRYVEKIVSPDLFIIGGGVSRRMDLFGDYLQTKTPVVAAQHRNNAGIIGAALMAAAN